MRVSRNAASPAAADDPDSVKPTPTHAAQPASPMARAGVFVRTHWVFLVLAAVGALVRGAAAYTYNPALFFYGDSFSYLRSAQTATANAQHPFGYSAFLRLMSWTGQLSAVTLVQHLAGLAIGAAVYVVLVRRGLRPWSAALVAAPLLLDAYLIDLEQQLMSETLFAVLMLAAVLLAIRAPLSAAHAAGAGALLATATITRNVALPLVLIFVAYLVFRRIGWRPFVAFAVGVVVPIACYGVWVPPSAGSFATSADSGRFLYARVAPVVDCRRLSLTPQQARLCPNGSPADRGSGNFYAWDAKSPYRRGGSTPSQRSSTAASFARAAVLGQPVTYLRQVGQDVAHYFSPGHTIGHHDSPLRPWVFPLVAATKSFKTGLSISHTDFSGNYVTPVIHRKAASALRGYQRVLYTPGPVMLLLLLLGLAGAAVGRGRRERADAALASVLGLSLIVVPAATSIFDYRYGLASIPLLCLGAGLGVLALRRRRDSRSPDPVEARSTSGIPGSGPRRPVLVSVAVVIALAVAATFAAPLRANPIFVAYNSVQAEFGPLGTAVGTPFTLADQPGSVVQIYRHGLITSYAGNTFTVGPPVYRAIKTHGGVTQFGTARGQLARWATRRGERVQFFRHGAVFVPRSGGARVIVGPTFDAWWASKRRAALGAPIDNAVKVRPGLTIQRFDHGRIVVQGGHPTITVTSRRTVISPGIRAASGLRLPAR